MARQGFWRGISVAAMALMLAAPLLAGAAAPRALAGPSRQPGDKLVMAFYYMWYGPDEFNRGMNPDRPVAPYISDHQDVIDRQVSEAKQGGIDAFVSSWTGTGTETDANFPKLLDSAAKQGFKATIYFETNSVVKHGDVVSQLRSVVSRFAGHPAFLRWNGKPVIFFWSPQTVGNAAAWRNIRQQVDPNNTQLWDVDTVDASYLDAFDSIHFFSGGKWNNSTDVAAVNTRWRNIVSQYNASHGTARLWTAGVIPGWDESKVQPPRNPVKVFPRRDGAMYEEDWRAAIASDPEWVTITSFNEWFENTQIEPSASYGNHYLDLTRQYANLWKKGPDPCDGGTRFAQTGQSICKQMEAYWQTYGGVTQFGYPISAPLVETNPSNGKSYMVQYFERARFELHPENRGNPYEVQLGLLGRQSHGIDPPAAPINDGSHIYFKETGHNASALFYAYWQQHGGLFVNGYPISEEFREPGSDGKSYSVQYFERARFELHPENPAPANVLLGFLGRQAWGARPGR
ncbi:MAG: endo-1,3-alpha-glucanase family glycosylhydrolase [Chloroflexia bacterium]